MIDRTAQSYGSPEFLMTTPRFRGVIRKIIRNSNQWNISNLGGCCSRFAPDFLWFLRPYIEGTAIRNAPEPVR
jgi:hypothetical protein